MYRSHFVAVVGEKLGHQAFLCIITFNQTKLTSTCEPTTKKQIKRSAGKLNFSLLLQRNDKSLTQVLEKESLTSLATSEEAIGTFKRLAKLLHVIYSCGP